MLLLLAALAWCGTCQPSSSLYSDQDGNLVVATPTGASFIVNTVDVLLELQSADANIASLMAMVVAIDSF